MRFRWSVDDAENKIWWHIQGLIFTVWSDVCRAVKLPWVFPGAPFTFNGAPGNIQGNLTALCMLSGCWPQISQAADQCSITNTEIERLSLLQLYRHGGIEISRFKIR